MGNSIGIDAEDEILRISCFEDYSFLVETLQHKSEQVINEKKIFNGKITLNEIPLVLILQLMISGSNLKE